MNIDFSKPICMKSGDILKITSHSNCMVYINVFHVGSGDLAEWEKEYFEEQDKAIDDFIDKKLNIFINKKNGEASQFDHLLPPECKGG